MKKLILIVLSGLAIAACQPENAGGWKPKDLLSYGLPITILAPDSVEIKSSDLGGLLQDVTIRGGDNYYIQIYASDAETNDIAKLKADQLSEVKANRYFSRIVREEEDGFIYENKIDSSNTHYGFRYIRVQGDKEYVFQTGLTSIFGLEQVDQMYEAVQPRKK